MADTTVFPALVWPVETWPVETWQGGADAPISEMSGAARWVTEEYVVTLTNNADRVEKP